MKILSNLLESQKFKLNDSPKLCHFMFSLDYNPKMLSIQTLSSELICPYCMGKEHYTPLLTAEREETRRIWLCAKCPGNEKKPLTQPKVATLSQKLIQWPIFCELSTIPDSYHNVSFEKIDKSPQILSIFNQFLLNPTGILVFFGNKGTGKTYSSLAILEKYLRQKTECAFVKNTTLKELYINSFDKDFNKWDLKKYNEKELLVIDDFALIEGSKGYLDYFKNLIDSRFEWSNRGTIITTNLNLEQLADYCGEQLMDRLNTGIFIEFSGPSKRKPQIIR